MFYICFCLLENFFLGWLFGLTLVDQHIDKDIVLESSNIILNDEKQKVIDIK